jgi:hypothetical protein
VKLKLISMNKTAKILLLLFISGFLLAITLSAQEHLQHVKKVYISPTGRVYIQKSLPVYLRISTSPDEDAESYLLKSEVTTRYSNPMYFDTEGYNTVRSPWRVDTVTKNVVYPLQDIIFEVYADSYPPQSKVKFDGASTYVKDGKKYFGKGVEITIAATDALSGVDKTYYSINNEAFKPYSGGISLNNEGEYVLKYYSVDNVGNVEEIKTESCVIDMTHPQTDYEIDGIINNLYISPDASIILKSKDMLSGVKATYYQINNGSFMKYSTPIPVKILGAEAGTITYYSIDNLGNEENKKVIGGMSTKAGAGESGGKDDVVFEFYVDNSPPEVTLAVEGAKYQGNYLYISPATEINLSARDDKSGVDKIKYGINTSLILNEYNKPVSIDNPGLNTVYYTAIDYVGNWAELATRKVYVDARAPETDIGFSGLFFFNRDTLYITKDTKIEIKNSDDESGINKVFYKIDNSEFNEYSSSIQLSEEGFHNITFYGMDNVNNEAKEETKGVFVDQTPPIIHYQFSVLPIGSKIIRDEEYVVYPTNAIIYLGSTDYGSGGKKLEYTINNNPVKTVLPIKNFKPGNYYIDVIAYDELNNKQVSKLKFSIEN